MIPGSRLSLLLSLFLTVHGSVQNTFNQKPLIKKPVKDLIQAVSEFNASIFTIQLSLPVATI